MRLLLIGRQSSLRTALRRWPLRIELTRDLVQDDLNRFISLELDNCPSITDDAIRNNVRIELESKSTVMFLWIKLIFQELRASFSVSEVASTLSRLPNELDREYCRLFSALMGRFGGRSNNPSVRMTRARRLLSLIVGASRPLTIEELRLAYAFASPSTSPEPCYQENLISEEGIIDRCGDFITTNGNLIYLGHTSVREFLLRPPCQWEGRDSSSTYFRLDTKECYRIVGLACLRYLEQVNWESLDLLNDMDGLTSRYPLLCYAAGYISTHLLESDLAAEVASNHIMAFLKSGKFIAWVEFAIFLESSETEHSPPLVNFWDDTLQLWSYWGCSYAATGGFMSLFHRLKQESLDWYQTYEADDSHAVREALISHHVFGTVGDAQHETLGENLEILGTIPKLPGTEARGLHRAVRRTMVNQQSFGLRQLSNISPTVKSILMTTKAFIDPFDVLIRAMQECLKRMSFISLMVFGCLIEDTRPEQALQVYEAALSKVSGKRDSREAFTHLVLGFFLSMSDGTEDKESVERHYSKSQDILQERSRNPIADCLWLTAAECRVKSLISLNRQSQASSLASEVEEWLTGRTRSSSGGSILREWCYRRLESSVYFARLKANMILSLGTIFHYNHLNEDADRILGHCVRGTIDMSCLSRDSIYKILNRSAWAMDSLGKSSNAKDTWIRAKEFINVNITDGKIRLNFVRSRLARIHYDNGQFHAAQTELSNFDIASISTNYGLEELRKAVYCQFSTYMMVGEREKAVEVLHRHLPAIETAFAESDMPFNSDLWFVVRLLTSHGEFGESEKNIRKMVSRLHSLQAIAKSEESKLHEALAFSLRLQVGRPKRQDPYDQYLACIELSRVDCGPLKPIRLQIGIGMACVAGDRAKEAADTFEMVATGCQELICGRFCVVESHRLLFRALAYQQGKNIVGAILLLSQMISIMADDIPICEHYVTNYENHILVVVSHMCLSEILDGSKNELQGNEHRKQALEILRREFDEAFDLTIPPRMRKLDPWTSRWARSCRGHILENMEGKVGFEFWRKIFPIEILWPGRNGNDAFYSYRVITVSELWILEGQ